MQVGYTTYSAMESTQRWDLSVVLRIVGCQAGRSHLWLDVQSRLSKSLRRVNGCLRVEALDAKRRSEVMGVSVRVATSQ